VVHTFDPPQKSRVAEGWAVVGIVLFMILLLWASI